MGLEWILLVAGVRLHEMIVGALAVAAASLFLWHTLSAEPLDLRWSDVLAIWRVPGMMLHDAWIIVDVLLKDLVGIQRAPSIYRASGFHTAARDPLLVARRVLVTAYTTSTPNSIVIGIDNAQSRLLVHQLRLTPPSAVERKLGRQG